MKVSIGFQQHISSCTIGCRPSERQSPQKISIDLELRYDAKEAVKSDALTDAVDYTEVAACVDACLKGMKCALLERACVELSAALRYRFPCIEALSIKLTKIEHSGYFAKVNWEKKT